MHYKNFLADILTEMSQTPEGDRNNTLFRLTTKAIRYALSGRLEEAQVLRELTHAALTAGLETPEIEKTIQSARIAAIQDNSHHSFSPTSSRRSPRHTRSNHQPAGAQVTPADWPDKVLEIIATGVALLRKSGELPGVLTQRGFETADLDHLEFFVHGEDLAFLVRDAHGQPSAVKVRSTDPAASWRYRYLKRLNDQPLPDAHNRAWHSPRFGEDPTLPVLVMEGELNGKMAWLTLGGAADVIGVPGTHGKVAWQNLESRRVVLYADGDDGGQLAVARWSKHAHQARVASALRIAPWKNVNGEHIDACDIAALLGRDELRHRLTPMLEPAPPIIAASITRPQIVVGRQPREEALDCVKVLNSGPHAYTWKKTVVLLSAEHDLREADESSLTSRLEAHADFVDDEGRVRRLTSRTVEFIGNELSHLLPRIDYVIEYPALLPDASVPDRFGYYPEHKTLVKKSGFVHVEFTVEAAISYLHELFSDFPFENRTAAFAAILGTLISHLAMSFIKGPRPMLVIDASGQGQGKTFIAQIIAIILTGSGSTTDIPKSTEELQKTLPSFLLEASPVVIFDNAVNLNRGPLKPLLTSTEMSARPLGKTAVNNLDNNTTWIATGLNLLLGAEMHRRAIPIRLSSKLTRPELKGNFRISDILGWTAAHRNELLSAVLAIIRNWQDAGKPDYSGPHRLGSFERYVQIVGGILEAANVPGFLEGREYMRHDPFSDAMTLWLEQVHYLFPAPNKVLAASDFVDAANGIEGELTRAIQKNVRSSLSVGRFLKDLFKDVGEHKFGRFKLTKGPDNQHGNRGYILIVEQG